MGGSWGGGIVDADIPMGVHLCYGDLEHKHFVEPNDLGWCVRVGVDIMRRLNEKGKKLSWMHMPVPKERFDTEYFCTVDNGGTDAAAEWHLLGTRTVAP